MVTRFVEEMSYVFLFTFFSLSLLFTLVAASISHFLTAATKFHIVLLTKNVSFVFFPISLQLFFSPVELRWPVALGSLFLYLFFSLFSKFVDMTINLILILQTTPIQKHFPLSLFVFIGSSQDAGGHTPSLQNNLKFGIGLQEVGVRTVGVLVGQQSILAMGLRHARFARGSFANKGFFAKNKTQLSHFYVTLTFKDQYAIQQTFSKVF